MHRCVEDEVAAGVARTDEKRGRGRIGCVTGIQPGEVNIVQNINIVDEDGLCGVEQVGGMAQRTTRVEQFLTFVADEEFDGGVRCTLCLIPLHEVNDLFSEMMDIDDDARKTCCRKPLNLVLQQRFSADGHKCFRHRVGEGFQTCAEAGSEDECLHKM